MTQQTNLVLGTFAVTGYEVQTLILVRSLRQFGGDMADLPVWIYLPEGHTFSGPAADVLESLDVEIIPFEIDPKILKFPFSAKAIAAGFAETKAEKAGLNLAWHDRTGMVRQAPTAFHLPAGKSLAFRPTDITNIGVPADQPLTPFWEDICDHYQIDSQTLTPITTAINQETIHLYVNAGLLVVRPEAGLLRKWADNLASSYALPKFKAYYQEKVLYGIFMHQAALTAAAVQTTTPEERLILPKEYLFSVDNFFDYAEDQRPTSLDGIVTGRFHDFFNLDNWEDLVIASDELIKWFKAQLALGAYWPKENDE